MPFVSPLTPPYPFCTGFLRPAGFFPALPAVLFSICSAFNKIRREYAGMLRGQLSRGNNGLTKTKYITFGVEAENLTCQCPSACA